MDARIIQHPDQVPSLSIPTDKLIELSADPVALRTYVDVHRRKGTEPTKSELQCAYQQALLARMAKPAAIDPEKLKVQHQPTPVLPTYTSMNIQPQWTGAAIRLTPEQRATNEALRQKQFAAQMRMLMAIKAAEEAAAAPALAA